ncbi:hypothetical protein Adt_12659 [Abeliophyllum distichum]|uniref:Uncharacterized protein n=1 Tax=Abeliophyllum distichum TaxID=126358 RepID=A0ABD1URC7_9LAMI
MQQLKKHDQHLEINQILTSSRAQDILLPRRCARAENVDTLAKEHQLRVTIIATWLSLRLKLSRKKPPKTLSRLTSWLRTLQVPSLPNTFLVLQQKMERIPLIVSGTTGGGFDEL